MDEGNQVARKAIVEAINYAKKQGFGNVTLNTVVELEEKEPLKATDKGIKRV